MESVFVYDFVVQGFVEATNDKPKDTRLKFGGYCRKIRIVTYVAWNTGKRGRIHETEATNAK